MDEYIMKSAAICIADYAADEHPYDKNPGKPETFSDYNQGWHDACDYIRERLENAEKADVAEVRHGRWLDVLETDLYVPGHKFTTTRTVETCSECKVRIGFHGAKQYLFDTICPNCGARMDGGADNE